MFPSLSRSHIIKSNSQSNIIKNAAIISLNDYDRIRRSSVFNSLQEEENQKKIEENQRANKYAKAMEHYQRIKDIDKMKQETGQLTKLSQLDKENLEMRNNLLSKAQKLLDENEDCVKEMNLIVKFAKISAIRDKQLEEKKQIHKIYRQKEQKLDLLMELDRLKQVKAEEEKDKIKLEKQRAGALIVVDQIKDRAKEKLKVQEEIKKEGIEMVKQIKKIEEEDIKELEKKKEHAALMAKEIEEINKNFAISREKAKNEERELDLKLLKYNMDKAKKEEEEFQLKKKLQDEKEKETQRLREKQEKVQDHQSEIDALRAKRAFEEADRAERIKAKEELIRRKKMVEELIRENEKQKIAKRMKLIEMVKKDQEEYDEIVKKQIEDKEREMKIEEERKKKRYEHNNDVMKQIKIKDENKKLQFRENIEEGRSIRQHLDEYYDRMNHIKQDKIKELKDLNVGQKYVSVLERYKIK